MYKNQFEEYVEGAFTQRVKKIFNFDLIKPIWFKTIGLVKTNKIDHNELKSDYDKVKSFIPDIDSLAKNVFMANKNEMKTSLDSTFNENIKETILAPTAIKTKDLFNRVKKGFIPSATFYPTLKLIEQFVYLVSGKKEFHEMKLSLTNEEIIAILCASFIYLFYKTIKEANELINERVKKQRDDEQMREKTYSRINKVLGQTLWSQEQLEQLISNQIEKQMNKKQDLIQEALNDYGTYDAYIEFAFSNNINNNITKYYKMLINVKNKSLNYITKLLIETLLKLNDKDLQIYLNTLEKLNPINEEVYSEAVKKSFRELVVELFPSLSFFPALSVWGVVDKMIKNGMGYNELTQSDKNTLIIYSGIFLGMVGLKIGINRIKDYLQTKRDLESINPSEFEYDESFTLNDITSILKKIFINKPFQTSSDVLLKTIEGFDRNTINKIINILGSPRVPNGIDRSFLNFLDTIYEPKEIDATPWKEPFDNLGRGHDFTEEEINIPQNVINLSNVLNVLFKDIPNKEQLASSLATYFILSK